MGACRYQSERETRRTLITENNQDHIFLIGSYFLILITVSEGQDGMCCKRPSACCCLFLCQENKNKCIISEP